MINNCAYKRNHSPEICSDLNTKQTKQAQIYDTCPLCFFTVPMYRNRIGNTISHSQQLDTKDMFYYSAQASGENIKTHRND